ncbi:MAG: RDD family protein [Acidimicrobiales bacterium]
MTDASGQTPPGWYYAAGDPPGTHRYWDGAQWQGGPQPVAGAPGTPGAVMGGRPVASLGPRFVAFLIDAGIGVGLFIVVAVLTAIFAQLSDTLGGIVAVIGYLGILGFYIWNYLVRQGSTGQTLGKEQQGIALLDLNSQPIGGWKALARYLLGGIIDNVCLINTLWIFFDANNQRLADKVIDANVYNA